MAVKHPLANLAMLRLVAVGRLAARVGQHRVDDRVVRGAAVEVHLHRDGVDRDERQPPHGVRTELALTYPTLVGLQMM